MSSLICCFQWRWQSQQDTSPFWQHLLLHLDQHLCHGLYDVRSPTSLCTFLCSPKKGFQAYIQAYISKLEMCFRARVLPMISGALSLIPSNRKGKTKKNAMEKFISISALDTQGKGVMSLLTKTLQCVPSGCQLSSLRILCWSIIIENSRMSQNKE